MKNNLNYTIKSIDIGHDAEMTFEAYANISNIEDHANDIIKTGAWDSVIRKANETGDTRSYYINTITKKLLV